MLNMLKITTVLEDVGTFNNKEVKGSVLLDSSFLLASGYGRTIQSLPENNYMNSKRN